MFGDATVAGWPYPRLPKIGDKYEMGGRIYRTPERRRHTATLFTLDTKWLRRGFNIRCSA